MKQDEIRFLRWESPSISGHALGMLVPARNCEHFLRNGFPFWSFALNQTINTAMALDDVKASGYRNVSSFADLTSYKVVSWKKEVKTASIMMSQDPKFDEMHPADCRRIALQQLAKLKETFSMNLLSSIEHEFTLLDEHHKPISNAGCYRLDRISKFDSFFAKIDEDLFKMGIDCDRLHSEVASGQYEITALPSMNIKGADDAYWIKNGLREMADQYKGWTASFVTHLPLSGDDDDGKSFNVVEDDSGAHFNHSLWFQPDDKGNKTNALWNATEGDLSLSARYWIGGILHHIGAIAAFACPTMNCYGTRFNSPWVSSEANWGRYNRTTIIRVKPSRNGKNTHFEFRLPSSMANPYLVMAAVVCAGLDGLKKKTLPPKECRVEMTDPKERAECFENKIPQTLTAALDALEKDKVFGDSLGPYFVEFYLRTKRLEIENMKKMEQSGQKPLYYSIM